MLRVESSDIKICLLSLDEGVTTIDPIIQQVIDQNTYLILNKEDAISTSKSELAQLVKKLEQETGAKKVWTMSCSTGQGVDAFLKQMIDILKQKYDLFTRTQTTLGTQFLLNRFDSSIANPVLITQARHREHLEDCVACLETFLSKYTRKF
jgi:tRNA modification GTPase